MRSCLVTHHGSVLCFGTQGEPFRHLPIEELDEAAIVVADADATSLRTGASAGQPVGVRPSRAAPIGLPRALGVGEARARPLVSLDWRGHHLCAGGGGPAIQPSEQINDWEEFLPLDIDDLALLRDMRRGGWMRMRNGRGLEAGQVWMQTGYALHVDGLLVDLREQPPLGGLVAAREGVVTLLEEGGWRIETFRRFDPVVLWRHDGTDTADEEIVLGLRSLTGPGGFRGRVRVTSRLSREALLDRLDGSSGALAELTVSAPAGMTPYPMGDGSHGPLLFLANGVVCLAPVGPLLLALAQSREVEAMPWRWQDGEEATNTGLFALDPVEGQAALPISAAIVGMPGPAAQARVAPLIGQIAANRREALGQATGGDGQDDLLRYVAARAGGVGTALLSRQATSVSPGMDARERRAVLSSFRAFPAAVRAQAMREALDGVLGVPA